MNQVAAPEPIPCKICGASSPLFGVVDFHKSCIEAQGRKLAPSGHPVYFRRCCRCGFAFTTDFDMWTDAEFLARIYNDDYILVDPDYVELRPKQNAELIAKNFRLSVHADRILDFGGGAGLLSDLLCGNGLKAVTYDPFTPHSSSPNGAFNLITCFEVLEHVPFPHKTAASMRALLAENGAILFSTLLQPQPFDAVGLNWWYAGPRNGHISLYTSQALANLFAPLGLRVASFSQGLHIAYTQVPQYAQHLNLPV